MFSTLISLASKLGVVKNILQSPKIVLFAVLAVLLSSTGMMYHLWKESLSEAKTERYDREQAELATAQLKSDYSALVIQTQEAIEKISKRNEELEKSSHDTEKAKKQHRKNGRARAGDVLNGSDVDILRQRVEQIRSAVHSRTADSGRRTDSARTTPAVGQR